VSTTDAASCEDYEATGTKTGHSIEVTDLFIAVPPLSRRRQDGAADPSHSDNVAPDYWASTRPSSQRATSPDRSASFHPFYVGETAAATTLLSWYAILPRFAMSVPDPQVRRAWLIDLRRCIETAMIVDELDGFCRDAPAAAGIDSQPVPARGRRARGRSARAVLVIPNVCIIFPSIPDARADRLRCREGPSSL
jgi:hypothetical protein